MTIAGNVYRPKFDRFLLPIAEDLVAQLSESSDHNDRLLLALAAAGVINL